MRYFLSALLAFSAHLSLLTFTSSARADSNIGPVKKNTGDLTLKPLSDLPDPAKPSLINGYPVSAKAFPSSFYQESADGSCTGTLIGRRVLLTAAHCVGNGNKVVILLKPGSTQEGTCTHHKDYQDEAGDISADYALCLLTANAPANLLPEVVAIDKSSNGQTVLLAGYGCVNLDATGADGKFRIGTANMFQQLGSVSFDGIEYPNYFVTYSDPTPGGGAILCPGDSGGAVYQLLDTSKTGLRVPTGRRLVVGVNSRYGKTDDGLADGRSLLSASRTKDFREFLSSWAKKHNVKICGYNEAASKCRKI